MRHMLISNESNWAFTYAQMEDHPQKYTMFGKIYNQERLMNNIVEAAISAPAI